MDYVGFVCRVLIAVVLIAAALGKARNQGSASRTVRALSLLVGAPLTAPAAAVAARLLVVAELATGALLLLGVMPLVAITAGASLVTGFVGASALAIRTRQNIPCSCFGGDETPLGAETLARALLLVPPLVLYAAATVAGDAGWWPTAIGEVVPVATLVLGALLLLRWLLTAPAVVEAVRDRRRLDLAGIEAAR